MIQGGQLLIVRRRLTLPTGAITTVDTGICQGNLGVAPDPPVGGEDPSPGNPGVASRVQVQGLAPIGPWVSQDIRTSEPRLNEAGTVEVDFYVAPSEELEEVEINVAFWNPHTVLCPINCDPLNELTCEQLDQQGNQSQSLDDETAIEVGNPATGSGQAVIAFVVSLIDTDFESTLTDPVADDAGWTLVRRGELDLGSDTGVKLAVFQRISADDDPATYTFSFGSNPVSSTANLVAYGSGYASGDDPVLTDAAAVVQETPTAPLSITVPSLTIPVGSTPATLLGIWIAVVASDEEEFFWDGPAGMFNQGSGFAALGDVGITVNLYDEGIDVSGPTGTRTDVDGDDPPEPHVGMAYMLALQPVCGIFPPLEEGGIIIDPGQ